MARRGTMILHFQYMSFDNLDHHWLNTTYTTTPCLPKTISSRKSWTARESLRGTFTYKSVCNGYASQTRQKWNNPPLEAHERTENIFIIREILLALAAAALHTWALNLKFGAHTMIEHRHWRRSRRRYPNARETEQKSIILGAKRKFISSFFILCCGPTKRKYFYGTR